MIKRNKVVVFLISIFFALIHYGMGFKINYQPDIYLRVNVPHQYYTDLIKTDVGGRIISSLIWWILRWMPFSIYYYVALIIGLLLISFATYRYGLLIICEIEKRMHVLLDNTGIIFLALLSCITIENIFSSEYFLYADSIVTCTLGVLLAVEASDGYANYLADRRKRDLVKTGVILFFLPFMYEIFSSIFLVLTLPLIIIHSASFIEYVKNHFIAGVLYLSGTIIKTIYTTLVINSSRAKFDQNSISEAVSEYAPQGTAPKQFILSRITFGMWGYFIACLCICILLLYAVIRQRRYLEIVKGIYIVVFTTVVAFIPFILKLTDDYKPRIYYPAGLLLGVMVTYGILNGALRIEKMHLQPWTILILMFVLIQWFSFLQMYTDCYITNYEDQYISRMIGQCIRDYEDESGDKVEYVSFYDDAVRTKYSMNGWCLTQRAYSSWGNLAALNFWLNEDYKAGNIDTDLVEYYSNRNWDVFSADQIVFIGDTAHICMY